MWASLTNIPLSEFCRKKQALVTMSMYQNQIAGNQSCFLEGDHPTLYSDVSTRVRSLNSSASSIQAGQEAPVSLPEGPFPKASSHYKVGAGVQSTWSIPSIHVEREKTTECLATLRIIEMVFSFLNCLPVEIKVCFWVRGSGGQKLLG